MFRQQNIRGGIKIKNRENLGQCPNRGGGVKIIQKYPNFNLGILKTEGGISIFQECPNFNLGILKTEGGSLFFKNVPISIWEFLKTEGGLYFSKMSEIRKPSDIVSMN